ncbi:MAG: response regulator [Chitinophagales bacterium]|nr:response regulator [Chitinophagales bacterium]
MKKEGLIVCNPQQASFFDKIKNKIDLPFKIIDKQETLNTFLDSSLKINIDICIIQMDLNWEYSSFQKYYGFEIAKKLRWLGLRCVFYFPTFDKKEQFDPRENLFSLLRIPDYHKIVQLPLEVSVLTAAQPKLMSIELLDDIHDTLIGQRELINERIHDLKNQIIIPSNLNGANLQEYLKNTLAQAFFDFRIIITEKEAKLQEIHDKMFQELSKTSKEKYQNVIEKYTDAIIELYPAANSGEEEPQELMTPWKVLVVDDDQNVLDLIESGLTRNNIQFHSTTNSQEALEILQNDYLNNITVLLCDLRLKERHSEIWQSLQGYDLITKIYHEHSNIIAFFAITSARKRLLHLKKRFRIHIIADYKKDIIGSSGALNLFLKRVRETGDEFFFKSRSQPTLSVWRKKTARFACSLNRFYRSHLFQSDYHISEVNINTEAEAFIDEVLNSSTTPPEKQFTATIKSNRNDIHPYEDLELLEKFRSGILVGRRIALALFYKGYTEEEIFTKMQPNADISNLKASTDLLFKTTLALSFKKDLPNPEDIKNGQLLKSNLLLEEINWLQNKYNIDFDLEQLVLNNIDLNIVINWLGNLQFLIKEPMKNYEHPNVQKFTKLKFENINAYKKITETLLLAKKTANLTGLNKEFLIDIAYDLEELNNPPLQIFIKKNIIP